VSEDLERTAPSEQAEPGTEDSQDEVEAHKFATPRTSPSRDDEDEENGRDRTSPS
jgi:hypothetical protein